MLVKELMSTRPDYLAPDASLQLAAEEMQKHGFGFIPIGDKDRLIGVITDRDITIRAIAKGKDPNKTSVRDFMTKEVLYCYEDDDVKQAAENMSQKQIHRLIVLNKNKRMTGILSLGDIAKGLQNEALCGRVVERISKDKH